MNSSIFVFIVLLISSHLLFAQENGYDYSFIIIPPTKLNIDSTLSLEEQSLIEGGLFLTNIYNRFPFDTEIPFIIKDTAMYRVMSQYDDKITMPVAISFYYQLFLFSMLSYIDAKYYVSVATEQERLYEDLLIQLSNNYNARYLIFFPQINIMSIDSAASNFYSCNIYDSKMQKMLMEYNISGLPIFDDLLSNENFELGKYLSEILLEYNMLAVYSFLRNFEPAQEYLNRIFHK